MIILDKGSGVISTCSIIDIGFRVFKFLDLKFDVASRVIPVLILFDGDDPVAGLIVVVKARCYDQIVSDLCFDFHLRVKVVRSRIANLQGHTDPESIVKRLSLYLYTSNRAVESILAILAVGRFAAIRTTPTISFIERASWICRYVAQVAEIVIILCLAEGNVCRECIALEQALSISTDEHSDLDH